jgi:hypothetical protein
MDKLTRGNGKDHGAPMMVDALTPEEMAAIEKLAGDASENMRCAEAGELGDPEAVTSMLTRLTKLATARPWLLYHEQDDPGAASVLDAYLGNGPTAEANARFFAVARSCTLALLVHVRKLEKERAKYTAQVDELARCILEYHPSEVRDEEAVDVAIRLLTPMKVEVT